VTVSFTPHSTDRPIAVEGDVYVLRGTLGFSGNYATNGDTLDFVPLLTLGSRQVLNAQINGAGGFVFRYDRTNKKVLVYQSGGAAAPMAELGAGAYPAGVTGNTPEVRVSAR
jgi:hypothetical protein